ncbi:MAG: ATP-dependent helicase HrpB, partial [Actinomycetota bacterium]
MSLAAVPTDASDLPVLDALPGLFEALRERGRAVLVAPPGAGKTTVVPLALLDEPWLPADGRVIMLEPRRLATRAAAQRMAELSRTSAGELVGHQTRDERRIGPDARIEVVTEGILTRRLQNDPELPGVSCVIFDEVHERNLPTDVGLALLLDVTAAIRPDLRLVAMSATPDIEGLTRVLDAPVVESEGRTHPVDVVWAPRAPTRPKRGRRPAPPGRGEPIERDVAATVLRALSDHDGDVLVFLPGIGEIRRTERLLTESLGAGIDVHPLAGALAQADQDLALRSSSAGRRRVVLATDIAETSLTVAGVRIVVDAGLAREPRFDARTGMTRLTTVASSRASADQRAGRAGRTEPGVAYRLWSQLEHGTRPKHRSPEILQADLAGFVLDLAAWGVGDPASLAFVDQPPTATMRQATDLLAALGAIDDDARITDLGRTMLRLPVHPRLARMLALEPSSLTCVVATLLDERDVLRGRADDLPADLALRVGVVSGAAGHDAADRGALHRIRDRAEQLARRLRIPFDRNSIDHDRTGAVLVHAFPDRVAGRRRPGQFTMRAGGGARLATSDALADEALIVAADLDGRRDNARVRRAAALDVEDLVHAFGDQIKEQVTLGWDADRDDLVETVERRLGSIRLAATTRPATPGDQALAALADRVAATGLAVLGWSADAVALRQRVEFLHRVEGDPWPDWSTERLLETLDEWLLPYLPGAHRRRDLEQLDVAMVLRSQLPWPAGADLDTKAPSRLEVETGREVPIDYSGEQPTASVRVQDL